MFEPNVFALLLRRYRTMSYETSVQTEGTFSVSKLRYRFCAHNSVTVLRLIPWAMTACSEVDGYQLVVAISCLQFQVPLVSLLQGNGQSTAVAHNLPFCELRDSSGCFFMHLKRIFLLYLKSENFQTLLCWVTSNISRCQLKLETVWEVYVQIGGKYLKIS